MKTIDIHEFTQPDKTSVFLKNKMYSVYLGNSQRYHFTSAKACKTFIVKTNKMLNDKFKQLNMIYGYIFMEYRKFYLFVDTPELERQSRNISDNFKVCEKSLDMMPGVSLSPNGNYFVFSHMFKCVQVLRDSCNEIIAFYKNRKHNENVPSIVFLIEQLEFIEFQLNNFGVKSDLNEDIILME